MKRIFLVDDDGLYQLILKRIIEKISKDLAIDSFKNGAEAVATIEQMAAAGEQMPDIIFLDINMPVMDGWQCLERIGAMPADVQRQLRIYMISTSLDDRDRDRALSDSNVREYICKPVSFDKLSEIFAAL